MLHQQGFRTVAFRTGMQHIPRHSEVHQASQYLFKKENPALYPGCGVAGLSCFIAWAFKNHPSRNDLQGWNWIHRLLTATRRSHRPLIFIITVYSAWIALATDGYQLNADDATFVKIFCINEWNIFQGGIMHRPWSIIHSFETCCEFVRILERRHPENKGGWLTERRWYSACCFHCRCL